MSDDEPAPAQPRGIGVLAAVPEHGMAIGKGIGQAKVQPRMHQDELLQHHKVGKSSKEGAVVLR
jgi:hypothetical protein